MRGRQTSVVANPVLVGAVTVLVVVVAVFLAYNANDGLPFVPTQTLYAELPDGAEVVPGVEVREGGYRIGSVQDMSAQRLRTGRVGAVLQLKLDDSAGPFPRDSSVIIRPRSPLALKIVQFERGRSREMFEDGEQIPVEQSRIQTDLDELYSLYDAPTRRGVRQNLVGYGGALTGRGTDLHATIRLLPGLFDVLAPVMSNLADPATDLEGFFGELGDAARIVAPVSREFARSFGYQADTFDAISRDPDALRDTISKGPPTMDDSISSFRVQRPFLRDTTLLSRDLNAATRDLRAALPPLNRALEVGAPVTRRSVALQDEVGRTMAELRDLAAAPTTNGAIRGLTATVTTLQPQLRFLGPYVTVCNYWNIFWTFVAEHFTAPDPSGSAQRVLLNGGDDQDDDVSSSMGANEYATGRNVVKPGGIKEYTHNNIAGGNALASGPTGPDGSADCTAGQQGYSYSANNRDDTPDRFYRRTVVDQLNDLFFDRPKGSTFNKFDKRGRGFGRNRPRVPEGQTFTDIPGGRAILTDHDKRVLEFRRSRGGDRGAGR
jgi:ABC-type transporter Mla subunit MlaD